METFVYRGRAYGSAQALWRYGRAEVTRAERVRTLGPLPPQLVYQVDDGGVRTFLVDPVDVAKLVRQRPDVRVTVLSVVH